MQPQDTVNDATLRSEINHILNHETEDRVEKVLRLLHMVQTEYVTEYVLGAEETPTPGTVSIPLSAVARLKDDLYEAKRCDGDPESAHLMADDALLQFTDIVDTEIRRIFNSIAMWYA